MQLLFRVCSHAAYCIDIVPLTAPSTQVRIGSHVPARTDGLSRSISSSAFYCARGAAGVSPAYNQLALSAGFPRVCSSLCWFSCNPLQCILTLCSYLSSRAQSFALAAGSYGSIFGRSWSNRHLTIFRGLHQTRFSMVSIPQTLISSTLVLPTLQVIWEGSLTETVGPSFGISRTRTTASQSCTDRSA